MVVDELVAKQLAGADPGKQITIRGLPEDLTVVPNTIDAWREWRRGVMQYRLMVIEQAKKDDAGSLGLVEWEKCRRDPAYFMAIYGVVYEPRAESGEWEGGFLPFIPYPFQVEMVRFFDETLQNRGAKADAVISKSRDMGASWTACLWALHGFLFRDPFVVGMVSRKEDLVDNEGDMDSLFEKIISNLERLPAYLMPEGFDWRIHRRRLKIRNPQNRNMILGESTTQNSGRGGRATVRIYDEAAFVDNFLGVWSTGANSTNHRIAISSESLQSGDDFYRLRTQEPSTRPGVLELDWWLHPEHDDHWYTEMRERFGLDEEAFQREVLRNPHAGFGGFVYPTARQIEVGHYPYIAGMPLFVGIDPGWDDDTALVWVAYDPISGRYRVVNAYSNNHMPPEYYADIIAGVDPSGRIDPSEPRFEYMPNSIFDVRELMDWAWQANGKGSRSHLPMVFGDPYGKSRTVGNSFYERMQRRWALMEMPMAVQTKTQNDARSIQGRRMALMNLLQRLDFDDNASVRWALHAIQEYRFESTDRPRAAEQRLPVHSWASHITTALEYVAVNLSDMEAIGKMDLRPIRPR